MTLASRLAGRSPKTAIILGSSLGGIADRVENPLVIPYTELPGFPVPKISGHAGKLVVGKLGGKEVAVLAGRAHPYESGNPGVMRPAIEQLREAGIETLILTNAAGSLKKTMRPGSIMLITDHINYSGMNPLVGQHGDENFVPMTDAYDPPTRKKLMPRRKRKRSRSSKASMSGTPGPPSKRPPRSACSRSLAARQSACRQSPKPSWRAATA
ncbi:MAG: purine-nucleoside phosphorylase [Rhizobiales bacterium]|nr:purine-nucleoside phosphorylase [Hyphomicrobiales bacterium]